MSSLTGTFNSVAASSTAGYGLFNQLQRALPGDQSRVTLLRNNVAEVQFDCCLSESVSYQSQPTQFPVEDGSMIADHIQTAPIQLQLTAVIADHPPEEQLSFFASGVSAVASAATQSIGAVGTLGATVGYASLASAALSSDKNGKGASLSRSAAMYATLRRLAGYGQVDDGAKPQAAMSGDVVDVLTSKLGKRFCRFSSMAIANLDVQRDNSVGSRALVFNITMVEVRRVFRSTSIVSFAMPAKQSPKQAIQGKKEVSEPNKLEQALANDPIAGPFVKGLEDSLTPGINAPVRGIAE